MELLIAAGMWVLYFIINSLAWVWVGMCLGSGALMAYELLGGNIKDASKVLKRKKTETTAAAQPVYQG